MEAFARNALQKFVLEHSECNFSLVDDIIITYMISVLESLGTDPDEVESSFDVEEFTEMMAAYIPGFDNINSTLVIEWMFMLSKRLEYGVPAITDKVEKSPIPLSNIAKNGATSSNPPAQAIAQTNNKSIPDLMSVQLSPKYSLLEQLSKKTDEETTTGLFDVENMFPSLSIANRLYKTPYSSVRTYSSTENNNVAEEVEEHTQQKFSYKEKIDKLMELFSDIPEAQLRRCLSRAKGNLEKAVKMILSSRNDHGEKVAKLKKEYVEEEREEVERINVADENTESNVAKLKEIFPKMSEHRLRDRLQTVNGDVERATQVLFSEEESRHLGYMNKKKYQVHKVSSKRLGLTEDEKLKLKKDTVNKYGFVEHHPDQIHNPIVLVKEESTGKIAPLNVGKETKVTNAIKPTAISTAEVKKPQNPKLNKKSRFR